MRCPRTSADSRTARRGWLALAVTLALIAGVAGCAGREAAVVSREALGTVVSITAYGEDRDAVRAAIDEAFEAMADVEAQLDAYDPASDLSRFNAHPYDGQALPADAVDVLDATKRLGVDDAFSPRLLAA